jgi:hypothetical protein
MHSDKNISKILFKKLAHASKMNCLSKIEVAKIEDTNKHMK